MANPRPFFLLAAPLTLALLAAAPAQAAGRLHFESETLAQWFQQERPDGDKKTGAPVYEYLRLDFGELGADGFSGHVYGWGRYDLGRYFDDKSAGEVLYGYAQYAQAKNNVLVRVGRQALFQAAAGDTLDGASASGDVTPYVSLSGYLGQPVALEEVNGRAGDLLWGGRVSHHLGGFYEVGLSYKRDNDDGSKNGEVLGLDLAVTPPGPVSLYGYSKRNLVTDEWAEHSYEARLCLVEFLLRPYYQRFRPADYLANGAGTPKLFRDLLFWSGDDTVTIVGADASWRLSSGWEWTAKLKNYAHADTGATSRYYAVSAGRHWAGASAVAAEVGRMQGDGDEDRYTSVSLNAYAEKVPFVGALPLFLAGDVFYARYDRAINGKDQSVFASLGGGLKLAADSLRVKVSGQYSADPYFDADFRLLAALDYTFDK